MLLGVGCTVFCSAVRMVKDFFRQLTSNKPTSPFLSPSCDGISELWASPSSFLLISSTSGFRVSPLLRLSAKSEQALGFWVLAFMSLKAGGLSDEEWTVELLMPAPWCCLTRPDSNRPPPPPPPACRGSLLLPPKVPGNTADWLLACFLARSAREMPAAGDCKAAVVAGGQGTDWQLASEWFFTSCERNGPGLGTFLVELSLSAAVNFPSRDESDLFWLLCKLTSANSDRPPVSLSACGDDDKLDGDSAGETANCFFRAPIISLKDKPRMVFFSVPWGPGDWAGCSCFFCAAIISLKDRPGLLLASFPKTDNNKAACGWGKSVFCCKFNLPDKLETGSLFCCWACPNKPALGGSGSFCCCWTNSVKEFLAALTFCIG